MLYRLCSMPSSQCHHSSRDDKLPWATLLKCFLTRLSVFRDLHQQLSAEFSCIAIQSAYITYNLIDKTWKGEPVPSSSGLCSPHFLPLILSLIFLCVLFFVLIKETEDRFFLSKTRATTMKKQLLMLTHRIISSKEPITGYNNVERETV